MPLTEFQATLARILSANRTPDSYLAGGAALHLEPHTTRYSNELDYFHDSVARVAQAYADDSALLDRQGYTVDTDLRQPGYIRAVVAKADEATKVEWAHNSAWRFLPTVRDQRVGYTLHPMDLATNKLLALAGRDEARDFLDILDIHACVLPLGALIWAAVGKDPGFTPFALLELLRRKGKYQPQDFARLHLAQPVDLVALKQRWRSALSNAEKFVASRPPEEIGCLYYSPVSQQFVQPDDDGDVICHFGRPGGVLPAVVPES